MISSNTRSSRSRYSSPAQLPNGSLETSRSSGGESQKTFLQRWLEPSVQNRPSFEEDGLMRYGVLETMAPLGALPKGSNPKKPAAEAPSIRKIILKTSGSGGADDPGKESTASRRSSDRAQVLPDLVPRPPPARQALSLKDLDEDYDPTPSVRKQASTRSPGPRRNFSRQSTARTPAPHGVKSSFEHMKEMTAKVVEIAVDEALRHYRYPTAWALRTLYDENSEDRYILAMIEDVYQQTADAETVEEFTRLIEDKKKEGKKDNKGCYYFVPPSTSNRFTPHRPKPAPYAGFLVASAQEEASSKAATSEGESHARKKQKTTHPRSLSLSHSHQRRKLVNAEAHRLNGNMRTPSRKHKRRDSASSESSLSSAMSLSSPEQSLSSLDLRGAATGGRRATRATMTTETSHSAPSSGQPITARGKTLTTQKQIPSKANGDTPDTSLSPTPPGQNSTNAAMPGVVAAPVFPNLNQKASKASKNDSSQPGMRDGNDATASRRRDAKDTTNVLTPQTESSVRRRDTIQEGTTASSGRSVRTRQSHQPASLPTTRNTRSSRKRSHDELEGTVSPTAPSFRADAQSGVTSRAATPVLPPPTKKQKTGLRVKTSPKKNGGTAAGVPRATGENPNTNGSSGNQVENDDYCSSCGTNGELVCCDNCSKSFHFECVDLDPESDDLPDEWFCYECDVKKYPVKSQGHVGAFASFLSVLDRTNPRAFSLPRKVQTFFEGVKAGADGSYEEATTAKTVKKDKKGYDELPDFFRQRDADGAPVLCHACQTAATDVRAIIPCNTCSLYWHLDCLDPPMSIPPVLKNWRCPAHAEDTLSDNLPLGPAHRFRKIKGSQPITPAFTRGNKNNGVIEIDDGDDVGDGDNSGWKDVKTYGRTFRLPSKGVILDFISQLQHDVAGYSGEAKSGVKTPQGGIATEPAVITARINSFSIAEAEVAIALATINAASTSSPSPKPSIVETAPVKPRLDLDSVGQDIASRRGEFSEQEKRKLREIMTSIKHALGSDEDSNQVTKPLLVDAAVRMSPSPPPSLEASAEMAAILHHGSEQAGNDNTQGTDLIKAETEADVVIIKSPPDTPMAATVTTPETAESAAKVDETIKVVEEEDGADKAEVDEAIHVDHNNSPKHFH